jgi:acrylyl-CoA reductase (NADPH)
MAVGTAGLTAMLCVLSLEDAGLPAGGDVLVTGAGGGVGSVAVAVLDRLGRRVTASTGRPETHDYLRRLGASAFVDRAELAAPGTKPLEATRWDGAVDPVGGTTLASVLRQTRYGGAVAACGLAAGMDLPASVAPFILRAVCLYGIDSVMCPIEIRREAWKRLENGLDRQKLATMTSEIGLAGVFDAAPAILEGQVRGRIVVKIG